MSTPELPSAQDVLAAAERLRGLVHRTPVLQSRLLNERAGAQLFFKCENLQRVGAFKFRGATNAVRSLEPESARRGVCTHSSGNHAQALALAARERGIPAHIVMPRNAPAVKVAAVEGYGGRITFCAPTLSAREAGLAHVQAETDAAFVHPYDDPRVIAGQGTAALELLEDVPELDVVLTPVGGGGLLSGTCLAVGHRSPRTRVVAAEPAGADDAYRSWKSGRLIPSEAPDTIADGLLTSLSERTFAILQRNVDRVVTVDDDEIRAAMALVWSRMKLVVEPSAAVPLAAVLSGRIEVSGLRVGIIFSGGNIDFRRFRWD